MKALRQSIATISILALGALSAYLLYRMKPQAEKKPEIKNEVLVRVLEPRRETIEMLVRSQGNVVPRTESRLVAEVSGRVLEVTPAFEVGASFEKGALLLRIESVDYELEAVRARAEVAAAQTLLAQQEAEAATAIAEWEHEHAGRPAPSLVAREPQLAESRARLEAARALLTRNERDLARCEVRAPYRGRVRARSIDRGGFVTRGLAFATIYAVDYAEVSLPLAADELAFVDLPLSAMPTSGSKAQARARVDFTARIAGKAWTWTGQIVRFSGEVDTRTRMFQAVARIKNPFSIDGHPERPALAVGSFVEASIHGRSFPGLWRVPRTALHDGNSVLVFREGSERGSGRIHSRKVSILRRERAHVLVDKGLEDAAHIVISPLDIWTEGMAVRIELNAARETKSIKR